MTQHPRGSNDLSRVRTPERPRVGRSARKVRATTSGITWLPLDQVPGAVLPPAVQIEQQRKLREIDECQARARVSARNYVIYR